MTLKVVTKKIEILYCNIICYIFKCYRFLKAKFINMSLLSLAQSSEFDRLIQERMEMFKFLLDKSRFSYKQYQYDGVEWCIKNELRPNPPGNARGGFIADEMGLGKTIMMIGTMFSNFLPRTLIVVPPVLIEQWFEEIYKSSGHQSLLYYGNNKKFICQSDINASPIVITTYNTLLSDNCILKKIVWNRVIFDEAHHLRNSKTKRFTSCKQINARVRWLVTGTPVQNKKQDFYNLCSAAGMKRSFYTDTTNLRIIGKNFVLRRTKAQVGINLPPVNREQKYIEWKSHKEMLLSEEIHSFLPNQTGVSSGKRNKLASIFGRCGTLTVMLRARQSCIMSKLMRGHVIDIFSRMGLVGTEYLEAFESTSKVDAVTNLMLERKDNGRGKIVFCHFQEEIDVIACKLLNGGMQKVVKYDGRNSGGHNLLKLAEPADALVIQIQTGCEGLNLQHHFSEIYFVSPHWNPFVEDQAIARCHRIGQLKPVDVFKFEMCGFKGEKIDDAVIDGITLDKYVRQGQDVKRIISREMLDMHLD
jgi:SNF2 family DNA or RNA helicase